MLLRYLFDCPVRRLDQIQPFSERSRPLPTLSTCHLSQQLSLQRLLLARPSIASSVVVRTMTNPAMVAQHLRRIPLVRPHRRTHLHHPIPIPEAGPMPEPLRLPPPIMTCTTRAIVQPMLVILKGPLRPPPKHSPPTRDQVSPIPLRLRPGPRY